MNAQEVLAQLKDLPPAPRVMPRLLQLLEDVNASTEDLCAMIELDATLTASIIGRSNSAYYASSEPITELSDGVARLGFREIYRIVTHILGSSFVGQGVEAYGIEAESRWANSVATGIVMEMMSKRLKISEPSTCYTLGLLHDIGKLVIQQVFGSRYKSVLEQVEARGIPLPEAEREAFGVDYMEMGAALLKNWDFPAEITEPIAYQGQPERAENHKSMAAMLHIARWVVAGIGGAPGKHAWAFEVEEGAFDRIQLTDQDLFELMLEAKDQLKLKEELIKLT